MTRLFPQNYTEYRVTVQRSEVMEILIIADNEEAARRLVLKGKGYGVLIQSVHQNILTVREHGEPFEDE